jgi:hypothetical protein
MSRESVETVEVLRKVYPQKARALIFLLNNENKQFCRLEQWRERQIVGFVELLIISAADLERAFKEEKISTVAWITRSLLELSIWIDYCNLSNANAKRFDQDGVRDMFGWAHAMVEMCRDHAGVVPPALTERLKELPKFGAKKGIPALADDFTRVSVAADEIGCRNKFATANKLFSKFAHPTAWLVHAVGSESKEMDFGKIFLRKGVRFAVDAWTSVRDRLWVDFPEIKKLGLEEVSEVQSENPSVS